MQQVPIAEFHQALDARCDRVRKNKTVEKEIETVLIKWLEENKYTLIGRQVKIPFGIIDILCADDKAILVMEVKAGKAPSGTGTQLMSYVYAVNSIILYNVPCYCGQLDSIDVYGVIVASSISGMNKKLFDTGAIGYIEHSISDRGISFTDMQSNHYGSYSEFSAFESESLDVAIKIIAEKYKRKAIRNEYERISNATVTVNQLQSTQSENVFSLPAI